MMIQNRSPRKTTLIVWAALAAALVGGLIEGDALAYGRPGHARAAWGYRHRPHLYAGGQLMGYMIAAQITDYTNGYLGHGGGGGLFVGGRMSPFFSLEGNWMITYHDETFDEPFVTVVDLNSLYLMTFTLDGKIHVPTMGPLEPYFQVGIGYALTGATYGTRAGDSIYAHGMALHLGGGIDFWLGPWFTLGGRLLYRGMYFGKPSVGLNRYTNFVNGFSMDVNAAFHF